MAALCYNLKKYLNFQRRKGQSLAKSVSGHEKETFFGLSKAFFVSVRGFLCNAFTQAEIISPKINQAGISSD
jgi:hypothetical protein